MNPLLQYFQHATPILFNRFNINEAAQSGRWVFGDPCQLLANDLCRLSLHAEARQQLGDRLHRRTGGWITFRSLEIWYQELGSDGWYFGVPIDTGTCILCDLKALAASFGRPELSAHAH